MDASSASRHRSSLRGERQCHRAAWRSAPGGGHVRLHAPAGLRRRAARWMRSRECLSTTLTGACCAQLCASTWHSALPWVVLHTPTNRLRRHFIIKTVQHCPPKSSLLVNFCSTPRAAATPRDGRREGRNLNEPSAGRPSASAPPSRPPAASRPCERVPTFPPFSSSAVPSIEDNYYGFRAVILMWPMWWGAHRTCGAVSTSAAARADRRRCCAA